MYEYQVRRREADGTEADCFEQGCLPTAEACRKDFLARFSAVRSLCCIVFHGYKCVAMKDYGRIKFRHRPDAA